MGACRRYRHVAYDPSRLMSLWEHVPTGERRWVRDRDVDGRGLARAFGRVLKLVWSV